MREIVFDTETTGLDYKNDRIIEIGAVELVNHFKTGRTFHVFICPGDRQVHPDALELHGISNDFLKEMPSFSSIFEDFWNFFNNENAKWIAHNATFDIKFINAELERLGKPIVSFERVIDTLSLARRKHPMAQNSLDALCRRYGINNSNRLKHGALLDSELLSEIYIQMIGGHQTDFAFHQVVNSFHEEKDANINEIFQKKRLKTLPSRITEEEIKRHNKIITKIGIKSIWKKVYHF
ncbi:DNA polymerase III epsilon subunit [Liberibacter crescens BT-1]|uniref:DNA polymerase III subunit epsilon n=1 Tax=Liberibacter crescens (strain BT-1) TaxID=1215343 RepID=L0EUZ5_LIBCB|nr:DNA polymerase III subunit epsilon [Liberibacter crescens]AGA65364.1 DNA polymerase III epsilon subunit [Liberibacter crescens BT-1]AMC12302.1 DNA polymerase III subunit epsilon [Liberibacter crescens]